MPPAVGRAIVDRPLVHLSVTATGLTAVAGSTAWQVIWLVAVIVSLLLQRSGRGPGSDGDGARGGRTAHPFGT